MSKQTEIYQTEDGALHLPVTFVQDDLWLSQAQMVALFAKNKRTISEHIRNIFKEDELTEIQVIRKFRTTADDGKDCNVNYYNLDVVISVGYRVKSQQGVRFRQWATKTLKQHLLQGYTINQQRFDKNSAELEQALALINKAIKTPDLTLDTGRGLVEIISRYTNTFLWLQRYDEGLLEDPVGQPGGVLAALKDITKALAELKLDLMKKGEATELFAQLREDGLSSIWGNLEQTVFGDAA